MRVSISELAKICGVSPGTVDRALNNRRDINSKTKEKILKSAKKYGYRPYVAGDDKKSLRQIGIIVFNLENEYFSGLITELESIFQKLGYCANIMLSHINPKLEIECIRNLYNMGVDGIVICPVNSGTEFSNYLKLFDIPIVATGNKADGIPFVGVDDFSAMHDFVTELLKDSYDEIIYFSPALNYPDAYAQKMRYEGFLEAAGNTKHTVITNIDKIHDEYNGNTLIICSSDYYALKVYFKTKNARITGFDNTEAIRKYSLPISTVGYSMNDIAEGVMDIITGKSAENKYVNHYTMK